MNYLLVDGVEFEMSETRFEQLRDTYAIIEQGNAWIVNWGYANFTYTQVMWFLDLQGE